MARFCTECGATLSDDKKFCTECGTPVTAPEEAMAAQPEATYSPSPAQPEAPSIQQTAEPAQQTYQAPPAQQAYHQTYQAPPVQQTYQQAATPVQPYQQAAPPVYGGEAVPAKGSKYAPITAGGYIGIMLLMCIPVIGLILTIVWACGGCRKVNKKSLARATLIMMAVGLVISLIGYFALRGLVNSVLEEAGLGGLGSNSDASTFNSQAASSDTSDLGALGGLGALFGGLSDDSGSGAASSDTSGLEALGGLGALFGGLSSDSGSGATNSDIEDLEALGKMLEGLGDATGDDYSGLSGLVEGAEQANREAEALNDGWPSTLRAYPGGTAKAVASYRTEISGTTQEEMMGWIEDLKKDGFEYQDFYEFGMSEEDMLGMNGWWAYDGNTYLSVSFYDGVVTIDHTKELPDLSSYFGQ